MPKSEKAKIVINNQKSRLLVSRKVMMKVRKLFAIKNKKAFWSPAFRRGQWDGWVRYVGEDSGLFPSGLLYQLIGHLETLEVKYTIEDNRENFKDLHKPESLGGLDFRDYQLESISSLVNNTYLGIRWQRGILNDATNSGKSLIAGGVIASFSKKRRTIFLTNNKTLFDQAYPDMVALFGEEEVGRVNTKYTEWKRVNVIMVQTLEARMRKDPKYKNWLAQTDIVIVDEADELIGRKGVKSILGFCYNATVRVALTGTALLKTTDPLRNQELLAFFGPILHKTTNKELVDKGVSTPPNISMYIGNSHIRFDDNYDLEYEKGIVKNKKRHRKIWRIVARQLDKNKGPILILFKEHAHARSLVKACPELLANKKTIMVVHGKTKNRENVFKAFNAGRVDILVASMIIKRGKNLPKIRTLINTAGGKSETTVLQIFGRALRFDKSKNEVDIIDFWDVGKFLQRHSKKRLIAYRNQGFPINEAYKKKLSVLNKKLTINKYAH